MPSFPCRALLLSGLLVCTSVADEDPWVVYPGQGSESPRVVLVSGDEEYRSEEALPQLGKILSERHGMHCTVLFAVDPETGRINPDHRKNIPGLEALGDADLMVIATRFRDLPDEQMAHIDAYVRAGKPVLGIRTATHAFQMSGESAYRNYTWNYGAGEGGDSGWTQGFGRRVLGETWIAHHGAHGRESTRGVVASGAGAHPIVRGLTSDAPTTANVEELGDGHVWGPTDVYRVRLPLLEGAEAVVLGQVLDSMLPNGKPVDGEKNDLLIPIAWTHEYPAESGTGRSFTMTIGAATDFEAGGTRRLFANAVYWLLGMDVPDAGANVDLVGDYDPTDYGFGGYVRGVRPSDHAIGDESEPGRGDPEAAKRLDEGDRVVVVGNTFAERLAQSGYFDAMVQTAHDGKRVSVRHVPWSGDEVGMRPREHSVPLMEDWLADYAADVVVLCFGMSESFSGEAGLADFETDLDDLLSRLRRARFGDGAPRLVLVSPIAHENLGQAPANEWGVSWAGASEIDTRNASLARYVDVMERVAAARGAAFVDLFAPSAEMYGSETRALTSNGVHPNELGCNRFVREMGRQLGWLEKAAGRGRGADAIDLRAIAWDKHWHERLLYRPTNTEYVWGRRHEPFGIVNFPPEMSQLRSMIRARDEAMWAAPKPSFEALFADPTGAAIWETPPPPRLFEGDSWEPAPVEAKGTETSLGSLEIKDPEAFKEAFAVADGYSVDCFASEQDFPDLASPLAMTFDERGRLWVLCAQTYPHLLPGDRPICRLIVLTDGDRDGKADQCTVFADRLYTPTGFVVDTDGVYLGQAPDLLKLTDTDGDGVCDRREVVLSGFSMPDSHHQISAFEWDPSGGFLMHEGVFGITNVETAYGTLRSRDAAVWRFDPRTRRLTRMSHSSFANPWGHAFDDFGQSVLADASGGDNYTFGQVIAAARYPHKPRKGNRFLNRGRPTAGAEIISSRHFPEEVQETFLVNQSIGFHGTRWDQMGASGSGYSAERMPQDLIESSDINFRPVGIETGPDGAIYIVDWCNPIIGHMQYSVRDPRRDSTHGRIWRIRHESRPLLTPPDVAGLAEAGDVAGLLELLRLPERNTRQHARRRLQTMAPTLVLPEVTAWLAGIDSNDQLRDRLEVEGLWLKLSHGRATSADVERVLSLVEPRARAAATRVTRHLLQAGAIDGASALRLLEQAVRDEDMRVRLEGVTACGFVGSADAATIASLADELPMDEPMRIALGETLLYLSAYGESGSDVARRFRLERMATEELIRLEMDPLVAGVILTRVEASEEVREAALTLLGGSDESGRVAALVSALETAPDKNSACVAIAPMLLARSAEALRAHASWLEQLSGDGSVGSLARAGLIASGDAREIADSCTARELADAISWFEPGSAAAAAPALELLSQRVESGDVEDPGAALAQIARLSTDRATLLQWLGQRVDAAARTRMNAWDDASVTARAALATLNGEGLSGSLTGPFAKYRISRPSPESLALGREVYHDEIVGCARCHGADGRGAEGFPPLAGSKWLMGRQERAASIVVHGLTGELRMHNGAVYESAMAPLGPNLTDGQIAAVLNYARNSFGNIAEPVSVEDVAGARLRPPPGGGLWQVSLLQGQYPFDQELATPISLDEITGRTPLGPYILAALVLAGLGLPVVLVLLAKRRAT